MKTQLNDERVEATAQLQVEIARRRQIEAELRESETRFRKLFENSPNAIFVIDLEGTILDVNPPACQFHNAEPDALQGQNVLDLAPAKWKAETARALAELVEGKREQGTSKKPGEANAAFTSDINFASIDYAGKAAILLHIRDIAEHKQAERTLQRRNRDLSLLNQASQVLNSTLDLDKLLAAILDQVREIMGATASSIWLIDDRTNELVCKQSTEPGALKGWRVPSNKGIVGWTTSRGESFARQ